MCKECRNGYCGSGRDWDPVSLLPLPVRSPLPLCGFGCLRPPGFYGFEMYRERDRAGCYPSQGTWSWEEGSFVSEV